MIDDILDITQDSETLGKPALHDFKEGKTTLPYIYLYEALDDAGKQKLISLLGKTLKSDELSWLKEQFEKHNIVTKAYNEAKALVVEAIELMNKQGESNLSKIAMSMIDREF
jgi:octaprenyl-diphosphate synthase